MAKVKKVKKKKKACRKKKVSPSPSFGENKKTMSPQPAAASGMTNNAKLGKYIDDDFFTCLQNGECSGEKTCIAMIQ